MAILDYELCPQGPVGVVNSPPAPVRQESPERAGMPPPCVAARVGIRQKPAPRIGVQHQVKTKPLDGRLAAGGASREKMAGQCK
jgi:hypothetical protein